MKQVTANVYTRDQFSVPPNYRGCNPSFVTTSKGIVMIDSPLLPTDAIKWRDEIAKRGEVIYIMNTDYHYDHVAGNFFFSGTVISHEGVKRLFDAPPSNTAASEITGEGGKVSKDRVEWIGLVAKRYDPEGLYLMKNYQLKPPSITFSERLSLDIGNHTFELIYLPGHTPVHIGIYIPQEKVFFSGDNFTNGTQPSLEESLPLEWIKSLMKIESLDIDAVIPGHGEVSDKSEVRKFRQFIQKCIDLVRDAMRQGLSKEQAADKISFENLYPEKRSGAPVHPGSEMQHANVSQLYKMLSK